MWREGGVLIGTSVDGNTDETSTYTCGHCNSIHRVRPKERPEDTGGLCKQCMTLICPKCVDAGYCRPFEKQLEAWEARAEALRSYGMS